MIFFLITLFLFINKRECNLLRTPDFMIPLIPSGIIYFDVVDRFYEHSFWEFYFPVIYVPFSYPNPRELEPEHPYQAIFIENNRLYITQPLVLFCEFPAYLKITAYFRMPYVETQGEFKIYLSNHTVLKIKFEQTIENSMIQKVNYVMMSHLPNILIVKSNKFEHNSVNQNERNGYQLFKIELEMSDEKAFKKHQCSKINPLKRKSDRKCHKYAPLSKYPKLED